MRRFAVPLGSYVAITVVVPVLNGATLDGALAYHGAVAIGLPAAIAAMLALFRARQER